MEILQCEIKLILEYVDMQEQYGFLHRFSTYLEIPL